MIAAKEAESDPNRTAAQAPAGRKRAWIWPAVSCALVLACIQAASPFNEVGFCDDWSYADVALKLAQTGHVRYNGWGSPILLFQAFWALPWIKLFGFSFEVLQVSMLPITLGFVLLVYATGRQVGLSPALAAFASIASGTSPLFLPMAATFMTDVPGCFFSLLCIYAALKSLHGDPLASVRWLWVLALAGFIGGANRQIVWAAPLTLIPYLVWMRRNNPTFRMHAVAAYVACCTGIALILHFFGQPYGPTQLSHAQMQWLLHNELGNSAKLGLYLLLVAVLVSMPAFFSLLSFLRRKPPAWLFLVMCVSLFLTLGAILARLLAPYGNNILDSAGVTTGTQESPWLKVPMVSIWIRLLLTVLVNTCILTALITAVHRLTAAVYRSPHQRGRRNPSRWDESSVVFVLFSLTYLALLLPGILSGIAYDRYMLPIIPLIMLAALRLLPQTQRRIPLAAWFMCAAYAWYAVATTHDYFAALRARVAVAHELERTGIERHRISAAVEYDFWVQVQRTGHARVVRYEDRFVNDFAKGFWFELWDHFSGFSPDIVVLDWNPDASTRGSILKKDFSVWLPPRQRSVVAWRRSDLSAVLLGARITPETLPF